MVMFEKFQIIDFILQFDFDDFERSKIHKIIYKNSILL